MSLEMNAHEFERFLNHLPFMVACVDKHQKYLYVNNRYASYFDILNSEDVIGKPVQEVLSHEHYNQLLPALDRALGGALEDFEIIDEVQGGGKRVLHATVIGVFDGDGQPRGYNIVIQNISRWQK